MKRRTFVLLASALLLAASAPAQQHGGELRFCLRAEPKSLHPLMADRDEPSETIRYLVSGVLIRVNRLTQEYEPELAISWKTLAGGRQIQFRLREGVTFSDGTPFTSGDVAYTFRALMDPELKSPTADSFRSAKGEVTVQTQRPHVVTISFPAPVAGFERNFDQVPILSAKSPLQEKAVLGPFSIAEHRPGNYILLAKNPHYWKRDSQGRSLPYLDRVRLDILQNEQAEILRFTRRQVHLINRISPEHYERLSSQNPQWVHDAGPSMDNEMIWFNQTPSAPIPAYKKEWFQSKNFRRAVSAAIQREDICRVVYRGHARPAPGIFPTANRFWHNAKLEPHAYDLEDAGKRLAAEGFRLANGSLRDRAGNQVEFSLVTNAGTRPVNGSRR
jgi:peptide/nickel transport system substrate-binding protein